MGGRSALGACGMQKTRENTWRGGAIMITKNPRLVAAFLGTLTTLIFSLASGPLSQASESVAVVSCDSSKVIVVHLLNRGSAHRGKDVARIAESASEHRDYAPIPRAAFFDIAYPDDRGEYAALAGYGLLLVTIVTQDSTEIPLSCLHLRGEGGADGDTLRERPLTKSGEKA